MNYYSFTERQFMAPEPVRTDPVNYRVGEHVGFVDLFERHGPIEAPMPERWYVLQTFPNKERKVMRTFRDRGISAYHPVIRKTKTARGRRIETVESLFAGVIFIPDFQARAGGVRVEGVDSYLRMGDCYPYLLERDPSGTSVQDMAWVRSLEQFCNVPVVRRRRLFKVNDAVRVVDGPFASFLGLIERLDSNGRLKVLVNIFSRMTPVKLDEDQIEAA